MATTSTSFMAAPGGYGSILASKLDKIDCSQVLAAVLKADRQLLGHIKMGPAAQNIEFNWLEDELNAVQFEGYTSVSGSIIVVGFTGSASLWARGAEPMPWRFPTMPNSSPQLWVWILPKRS